MLRKFEAPYALSKELYELEVDMAFERAEGPGVMKSMRTRAAEIRQELLRLEYEYFAPERKTKRLAKKR
jgi:hypothetical protein